MKQIPVALFTLMILITISCSNPIKKFEEAKKINTITAYEDFISNFPESSYKDSALIQIRLLKPIQGTWVGNDIMFNVSVGGEKIKKENSKLDNSCSVIIKVHTSSFTQSIFIYDNIPISNDGNFEYMKVDLFNKKGNLKIKGKFYSPNLASGKFTLIEYGHDKINGTTKWKANTNNDAITNLMSD